MEAFSDLSPWAIREQLERIEQSPQFVDAGRLRELLKHIVECALTGDVGSLKEAAIGNMIYSREPAYDPRFDSTVRVEARRLRRKLKEYYSQTDHRDRILIELPTGSYVPIFSPIAMPTANPALELGNEGRIFRQGSGAVLAIMPITSLSNEPDDIRFADELTDELIFVMESAPGWRVASRSTIFRYKNRDYSVADVARELGAHGILQGTVRRNGQLLRVTVEVSDPDGFVGWSDRFDLHFDDRFALQEQIATTIQSRIGFDTSKMRAAEIGPSRGAIHVKATVYRARQLLDRQSPASLGEALELFTQATQKAQDYARGFAGIADCHCDLFRLGVTDRGNALRAARDAAEQALEIDPASIESHTSLATVRAWLEWDRAASETSFREALRLGGNARCARLYGVFLTHDGRQVEAERMFRRARMIEPISNQQDCAEAVSDFQSRRLSKLATQIPENLEVSPEVAFHRGLAFALSGRPDEALRIAAELDLSAADYPLLVHSGAEIRAWAGQPEEARAIIAREGSRSLNFVRATLAMAAHAHGQALDALTEALERQELGVVWIRTDARFDRIRDEPRFHDLIARLDGFRRN